MTAAAQTSREQCVVRRTLGAPPPVVYRVWTEPKYQKQWSWGHTFSTLSVEIDCRVGGVWRQQIRDKKTGELWSFDGEFREVVPERRLVHTFHWVSDRGTDHGASLVAIDFLDRGKETEVVITHTELRDAEVRRGTETGWGQVLDCVADTLSSVDDA